MVFIFSPLCLFVANVIAAFRIELVVGPSMILIRSQIMMPSVIVTTFVVIVTVVVVVVVIITRYFFF